MPSLQKQIQEINNQLKLASSSQNTNIQLLVVSKGQDEKKIEEVFEVGQKLFGENYVQEAIEKQKKLVHLDIKWHFIGPIQSNKCKLIAENFSWVHSVDRIKVANKLNDAINDKTLINVCIQVNISNEDSKSGLKINEIDSLAEHINTLDKLTLRGLMAIPTNTSDDEFLRETGSTYKIGIKHSDWHTVGESFYSPLGDDYYEQDWLSYPHIEYDNYRIYYVANEMPYDDNFQGRLMKEGKLHEAIPSMPAHAYHLDTYKTGQYLKQKAIAHEACDYVNGEVVSFKQDENGYVKSITTKTGQVIEGDLFVDCTGFSRFLCIL